MSPQGSQTSQSAPVRTLISRRAYADLRGISEKAVRKAIASGKIPTVEDRIDPEIADAAWLRNRDAGQQSKLAIAISGGTPPTVPVPTLQAPTNPPEPEEPPAVVGGPEFRLAPLTAARIENTQVSTAIKEIARRKLAGELLDSEEVERNWGQMLQVLKDRLRLIPDNLGELLAASVDPAECRSILMREILDALTAVSKGVGELAA